MRSNDFDLRVLLIPLVAWALTFVAFAAFSQTAGEVFMGIATFSSIGVFVYALDGCGI